MALQKPESKEVFVSSDDLSNAKIVWDYMMLQHELKKSDVILGLGCSDRRIAEHCARLWLEGWAPTIVFSGGHGHITKSWKLPECEVYRDIAVAMGVPEENIIMECNATNTMENITETHKLLQKLELYPESFILVHRPFMERRSYATFMKLWPNAADLSVCVTSPPTTLEEYPNADVGDMVQVITVMIGCLQRIMIYPTVMPQDVPQGVMDAYNRLADKPKYQGYLVKKNVIDKLTSK